MNLPSSFSWKEDVLVSFVPSLTPVRSTGPRVPAPHAKGIWQEVLGVVGRVSTWELPLVPAAQSRAQQC